MNLRCIYCQTPFTLARGEMLAAIVHMHDRNMNHYDAHCPRCRRANSISRQRMELFFPNWQEAVKQFASAPPPAPKAEIPATAFLKTEPISKVMKEAVEKKAAEKTSARKRTAAKAPAAASSSKGKKPAVKKTTAKTAAPKPKKK